TGGLVAVAQRPRKTFADLKLSACPLLAVVDQVGKPGNLGAIIRSADGAGVEAAFVTDSVIDIYGPNVIRASIGTIFSVPVVELNAAEALGFLRTHQIQIVAGDPAGSSAYTEF